MDAASDGVNCVCGVVVFSKLKFESERLALRRPLSLVRAPSPWEIVGSLR